VLTIAPLDARVPRVMERGSLDRAGPVDQATAIEMIREKDRETSGYLRYLFNVDWLNPQIHDLVINTASLGVPSATDAVIHAIERMNLKPTPETLARLEDLARTSRAEAEALRG
jgi:cytidylate kinase